jgi:hypothetical protein
MNNMVGIGPGCSSLHSFLILVGFKMRMHNAHWAKSIQCESAEFSKTEHFVYLKFIVEIVLVLAPVFQICKFLGHPDLLIIGTDPDPRILPLPNKNGNQNHDFLLFCDFFMTFLSLKNDVNIPSKCNMQKTNFFCILKSRIRIRKSARGTDLRIQIRTNTSRILNTE